MNNNIEKFKEMQKTIDRMNQEPKARICSSCQKKPTSSKSPSFRPSNKFPQRKTRKIFIEKSRVSSQI